MWAMQLVETGSVTISEDGTTDDWTRYYPNTVPKPFEMLTGLIRTRGDLTTRSILVLAGTLLVCAAAYRAGRGGSTGAFSALFIGMNPVFILLALRSNPAVPFIGALILMQTTRGGTAGAVLSSLVRPEGFIYGAWRSFRGRDLKLAMMLLLSAAVWLALHKLAGGSFMWASREVRYSVSSMSYPTTNTLTFFPWAFLRSILVLGAPGAAILYRNIRRWELALPFTANFLLLALSLSLGSLVLARYIDQLFLLAVPFIFIEIAAAFRGRTRLLVACAVLLFPAFQWIPTIPEIRSCMVLREFYCQVELPDEGITATNELLIPGIALENGISDPRLRFVSSDRAAYEGADEGDLLEKGVSSIIVYHEELYFPVETREWLQDIGRIEVKHYPVE